MPPCSFAAIDPSAAPCLCPTAYPLHLPVGAGHARPATSRLPPLNPRFVGRGLDPSAAPCPYPTPYPFHLPVGAGHARPATSRLPPLHLPFVGRGLDPSAAPCPYRCFTFHSVGAAYMPPAPPLSKGDGRACEAGGIPAALPFCLPYPFTSFTSFSPLANARAFSIVVMAMLCNAVRVKNA